MKQLSFSMMEGQALQQQLERALYKFSLEERMVVDIQDLAWENGRSQLVDIALFKGGVDVSEVGTTWLSSLVSMNGLRPISHAEALAFGGKSAFFPGSWDSAAMGDQLSSIPWTADTRFIFYRKDMLAEAGLDENSAFQDAEAIAQTLLALQANGVDIPISIPTASSIEILHMIAFWVWSAGGEFMSQDGRTPAFTQPEALAGITQFYKSIAPVLSPSSQLLSQYESRRLFTEGKAAIAISGYRLLHEVALDKKAAEIVQNNFGVAVFPGPHFLGGSNLVIWNHCTQAKSALKLIEFLTRTDIQQEYILPAGWLPAKIDALSQDTYISKEIDEKIRLSLQTGRSFKANYLWGMAEDRLNSCFNQIWKYIFTHPEADIEEVVIKQMKPVALKLKALFSTSD